MTGEGILSTVERLATALHRLDDLTQDVKDLRAAFSNRLERLENHVGDLRERLARLEASREADIAKLESEVSRFRSEVERAELKFSRQIEGGSKKGG